MLLFDVLHCSLFLKDFCTCLDVFPKSHIDVFRFIYKIIVEEPIFKPQIVILNLKFQPAANIIVEFVSRKLITDSLIFHRNTSSVTNLSLTCLWNCEGCILLYYWIKIVPNLLPLLTFLKFILHFSTGNFKPIYS